MRLFILDPLKVFALAGALGIASARRVQVSYEQDLEISIISGGNADTNEGDHYFSHGRFNDANAPNFDKELFAFQVRRLEPGSSKVLSTITCRLGGGVPTKDAYFHFGKADQTDKVTLSPCGTGEYGMYVKCGDQAVPNTEAVCV